MEDLTKDLYDDLQLVEALRKPLMKPKLTEGLIDDLQLA